MPKLPFVGGPYPSRSVAAAASELTNLYVEMIENPDDRAKNTAALFGAPGRHVGKAYASATTRGLWSGGGRLFIANGTDLVELNSSWAEVSRHACGAVDDGFPVQIFGNGTQLLIISAGQAYVDNGAGPVACRFLLEGTVTAVTTAITWQSGDKFTSVMVGQEITVGGYELLVTVFTDDQHITVTPAMPAGLSGTVSASGVAIFWTSGDQFTSAMEGFPIIINGVSYTVATVLNPNQLALTTPATAPGVVTPALPYITGLTNLPYSAAGGDLVTAVTGGYLDGSFYVQRPAGGSPDLGRTVNFSDVNDGTTWRGLSFFVKEGAADYIQSILIDSEIIYVFGTETCEAWQNDPNSGLPVRIPGAMAKYGSISHWGPIAMNGKVYLVGGDAQGGPVAYRIDNSTPTRISTHAEEEQWNAAGLGVNCISYSYMEEGHIFWVINFGAQAWAWDETSKKWSKRMCWSGSAFTAYLTSYHTYIPEWGTGKHITCGNVANGNVYESSVNFYDDGGADLGWRVAIPYRYNGGNLIYFGLMVMELETGTVASGAAPTITRDYSDDRGVTFIQPDAQSIGVHAASGLRVQWFPAGASRGRVWRFTGAGQYKVALIDLQCDESLGDT